MEVREIVFGVVEIIKRLFRRKKNKRVLVCFDIPEELDERIEEIAKMFGIPYDVAFELLLEIAKRRYFDGE